jgi:hypothetical protein
MYLQADADDRDDLRGGDQAVHDVVHARDNGRILQKNTQENNISRCTYRVQREKLVLKASTT